MANRETMTVDGVRQACLNVSETVGEKFGANKMGDVMLVQAMFKYIVGHLALNKLDWPRRTMCPNRLACLIRTPLV